MAKENASFVKKHSKRLAQLLGITEKNISLLKIGRIKGLRSHTLEKVGALLKCQSGDPIFLNILTIENFTNIQFIFDNQRKLNIALRMLCVYHL